jgi:rhodopsin domain-containing protein
MIYIDQVDLRYAIKLNYISLFFWSWTIALIKISVCLMLLRIKNSPPWKWGFAIMMLIQFACGTALTITLLLQCQPVQANWNKAMPGAKCWTSKTTAWSIYPLAGRFSILAILHSVAISSLAITTASDAACALLPLAFIVRVRRPLLEKFVLACIMGLGLLASILGTVKIFSIAAIQHSPDPIWKGVYCQLLGLVFFSNIRRLRNGLH